MFGSTFYSYSRPESKNQALVDGEISVLSHNIIVALGIGEGAKCNFLEEVRNNNINNLRKNS